MLVNEDVKAGLKGVWELYRATLLCILGLAAIIGLGLLVIKLTGSANLGVLTVCGIVLAVFWGYATVSVYRFRRDAYLSEQKVRRARNDP